MVIMDNVEGLLLAIYIMLTALLLIVGFVTGDNRDRLIRIESKLDE